MNFKILTGYFQDEIKAESVSTRRCLERIPPEVYQFRPHAKSMEMGYLVLLVADIPKWIHATIVDSVIDLETWGRFPLSTTEAMLQYYDENIRLAMEALSGITEEQLQKEFELKRGNLSLMKGPKIETIGSSINHWVHHRGQLTVYMRLNEILVPSIYGPSADEKSF